MGKWLDRARKLEAAAATGDNRDNSPSTTTNPDQSGPIVTNVTNVTASLPPAIAEGLTALRAMPVPPITLPAVWPEIVRDAVTLATEGWAQTALSLGWAPLHLWGASEDSPGLAVWLAGRRILVLDAGTCVVRDGPGAHAVFNRRDMPGACFLWELGEREGGRRGRT